MGYSTFSTEAHPYRNAVDALIIGAGPAGLSAALALGRVMHSAVVFDSAEYRNAASSNAHTVPTHDHESPASIRGAMREELVQKYKTILFAANSVDRISRNGAVFEAHDANGTSWRGRKVILATGCEDVLPDIPGYRQLWGKSILHCPFCRGFEEAKEGLSSVAFLLVQTPSQTEIGNILFYTQLISRFTKNIKFLLNGNQPDSMLAPVIELAKLRDIPLDSRPIVDLSPRDSGVGVNVHFETGTNESFDFVFHKPSTRLRGDLATELGLDLTSDGDIKVEQPMQHTSLKGVFAAGDCSTAMKQVAVAMGTGVSAGIAAAAEMATEDLNMN